MIAITEFVSYRSQTPVAPICPNLLPQSETNSSYIALLMIILINSKTCSCTTSMDNLYIKHCQHSWNKFSLLFFSQKLLWRTNNSFSNLFTEHIVLSAMFEKLSVKKFIKSCLKESIYSFKKYYIVQKIQRWTNLQTRFLDFETCQIDQKVFLSGPTWH